MFVQHFQIEQLFATIIVRHVHRLELLQNYAHRWAYHTCKTEISPRLSSFGRYTHTRRIPTICGFSAPQGSEDEDIRCVVYFIKWKKVNIIEI